MKSKRQRILEAEEMVSIEENDTSYKVIIDGEVFVSVKWNPVTQTWHGESEKADIFEDYKFNLNQKDEAVERILSKVRTNVLVLRRNRYSEITRVTVCALMLILLMANLFIAVPQLLTASLCAVISVWFLWTGLKQDNKIQLFCGVVWALASIFNTF